jgi:DNA-binding transcriptional MerR regulator
MEAETENNDKLFYTIGEVADMFKVNASLVRFWEKEFDIIKPNKNKKGNRLFTKKDIENFRIIYHLVKEKGFTLQGAKDKLKAGGIESVSKNAEAVESLKRLKEFLLEIKKDL